jgi:phospholipid/cholesterol/gamma-HCH transport system ATP-binding protein
MVTPALPRTRPSGTPPGPEELAQAPLFFKNVTFRRGDRVILNDVTLAVRPGETLALIGPSGAGKTTLFRLALGFLRPDVGEVWVAGREISRLSERELAAVRANVGIVFQDGALFTSMDVSDNVAFGLAESSLPEAELQERVRRTLASVGLEEFGDRMPDELSGGQAQRVAVARAIVTEPRVMLYDEPTQGLDPRRALDVAEQIMRLSAEGVASLAVTHQLEYARKYAHRIALLQEGQIQYDGSVAGLRDLDDPFVHSFFEVLDNESELPPPASSPTLH